ncbi:MAG: Mrp/NBP35 family ATP-binding protein [Methanocellales archaeon]|nr:Mrp/NBP35 family ATP-binding protein [Methanocellales archaeon]
MTGVNVTLGNIKHIVVVMSGKGGVGKTTVAVNLAFALSMRGYKVGLLDADITGPNAPKMLGIENEKLHSDGAYITPVLIPIDGAPSMKVVSMAFLMEKDSPVIWRGPLKMKAIEQFIKEVRWGLLDYLIVDLPPGTGDEPLSLAQLIPDSGALIVTTPQDVALLDSRRTVNFAKQLKMPVIGIVENMSGFTCPHCGSAIDLFKTGGGEKAARELGVPFLGSIPIDHKVCETGDAGKPLMLEHNSRAAKSFVKIVDRIEASPKE